MPDRCPAKPRALALLSLLCPLLLEALLPPSVAEANPLTEPMRARNLSPPIAIFGMPSWDGGLDAQSESRFMVVGTAASHFRFSEAGTESLILDGETWRVDFVYERQLGGDWSVGVELPLVRMSGGFLDDVIDAWHSFFNLPDGKRNTRPEDELQLYYDDDPGVSFFRSEPGSGFGDVMLHATRRLGKAGDWRVKLSLKLPTGETELLAGSGAPDAAVTVMHRRSTTLRSQPVGWFWGAGVLRLGQPDAFPARNRDWIALGMVGASWQPFPNLGFKLQLDAHSAFYDSELEELGKPAVQGTMGGWWSLDERRVLNVAVVEDLIVHAAPDVSLQLGFEWKL